MKLVFLFIIIFACFIGCFKGPLEIDLSNKEYFLNAQVYVKDYSTKYSIPNAKCKVSADWLESTYDFVTNNIGVVVIEVPRIRTKRIVKCEITKSGYYKIYKDIELADTTEEMMKVYTVYLHSR